ncbi:MAG: hypothetical protein K6A74_09290 [Lachnospiraceae bacterium]|nr:hypothetical protein [Lachnospiraceae bacterium]
MKKEKCFRWLYMLAVFIVGIIIGIGGKYLLDNISVKPDKVNDEVKEEVEGEIVRGNIYSYRGDELLEEGEAHSAAENYEISLQYSKDPEIMLKLADLYKDFQITEGDGCSFMWNFDRAEELYMEAFSITGDSAPAISFCQMCDEVILDPIHRDGYKYKILKYYGIKVIFSLNKQLASGEYNYYPNFSSEKRELVVEGSDIEEHYLEENNK